MLRRCVADAERLAFDGRQARRRQPERIRRAASLREEPGDRLHLIEAGVGAQQFVGQLDVVTRLGAARAPRRATGDMVGDLGGEPRPHLH